jgi:hypothetical protein
VSKHFTKGIVIGRITEIKDETTKENSKKYVTIKADVSSSLSGDVTAYCRMYDKEGSVSELKQLWNKNRTGLFKLQGIYSQYRKDESSDFMSSFTLFGFEPIESGSKRAYFIVVGEVCNQPSGTTDGGQRFLVNVVKQSSNGREQEELYEFWAPGDKLLDAVAEGDTIRVKGLVRQKTPDGVCGGEGDIRAYLESLEIQNDGGQVSDEDIPY